MGDADTHFRAGRPIVLIHGFLGAPIDWDSFRCALRKESSEAASLCITVDLLDVARRIQGNSKSPITIGLSEFASTIRADLEADERVRSGFDVVGYSMGGRIALEMAAQLSEAEPLGGGDSSIFILLSAHPGLDDAKERDVRASSDIRLADRLATLGAETDVRVRQELAETFLEEWYGQALFSTLRNCEEFISLAKRRCADLSTSDSATLWAAIVAGCSPGRCPSRWDAIPRMAHDCRVVAGDRDARYVAVANRAHSIGVPAAFICDAGHAAHIEQPAQFAAYFSQLRVARVQCLS